MAGKRSRSAPAILGRFLLGVALVCAGLYLAILIAVGEWRELGPHEYAVTYTTVALPLADRGGYRSANHITGPGGYVAVMPWNQIRIVEAAGETSFAAKCEGRRPGVDAGCLKSQDGGKFGGECTAAFEIPRGKIEAAAFFPNLPLAVRATAQRELDDHFKVRSYRELKAGIERAAAGGLTLRDIGGRADDVFAIKTLTCRNFTAEPPYQHKHDPLYR